MQSIEKILLIVCFGLTAHFLLTTVLDCISPTGPLARVLRPSRTMSSQSSSAEAPPHEPITPRYNGPKLDEMNPKQKEILSKRIIEHKPLDLPILVGIAEYEGSMSDAIDTAANFVSDARNALKLLKASESTEALRNITFFVDQLLEGCR